MLKQYDYDKLKKIIDTEKTKITKELAKDTDDCLLEVTVVLKNFFDFLYNENAETIANSLIALDSWMTHRQVGPIRKQDIKMGNIYMADLGFGYNFESGYYHPILVLDVIGASVVIVPVTSSRKQVISAPTNKFVELIEKSDFEDPTKTLDSKSVAIISNIRSLSSFRLSSFIGKIKDKRMDEIKEATAHLVFNRIMNTCDNKILDLQHKLDWNTPNDYY